MFNGLWEETTVDKLNPALPKAKKADFVMLWNSTYVDTSPRTDGFWDAKAHGLCGHMCIALWLNLELYMLKLPPKHLRVS